MTLFSEAVKSLLINVQKCPFPGMTPAGVLEYVITCEILLLLEEKVGIFDVCIG